MLEFRDLAHTHLAISAQGDFVIGFDEKNAFPARKETLQFFKHRRGNVEISEGASTTMGPYT
jgi:hypothetical protein